jgi:LAS superfamily LD-carboxypeptidase LdcB
MDSVRRELDHKRILTIAALTGVVGILLACVAYAYSAYEKLAYEKRILESEAGELRGFRDAALRSLAIAQDANRNLTDDNRSLGETLSAEQSKNMMFANQIEQISGTVGKLEKLSRTPEELLKKYSKVYFLNENYVPTPLVNIDAQHLLESEREQQVMGAVWPFLTRMLVAAMNDGRPLLVASAYRSFGEQSELKASYRVQYGYGANQFSADQGYSEHQLGTTVDLTTRELGGISARFDETSAFGWLQNNAHRYGFVLSYPKGNTYYQYEPWHWRFVGTALATHIHDQSKHFYDLMQNELDAYLINIFD